MADEQVLEKNEEAQKGEETQPEAEMASPDAAVLQSELENAQAKAAEYLDGWQRERAAFANYKKRAEADRAETTQNAKAQIISRFLAVLDDFDRAMKEMPPMEGEAARWAEGMALIHKKLQNLLEAEGVLAIQTVGETFDPERHEAVTHEASDGHQEGEIIGEVRKGYKIGERVLRPALVRVAK